MDCFFNFKVISNFGVGVDNVDVVVVFECGIVVGNIFGVLLDCMVDMVFVLLMVFVRNIVEGDKIFKSFEIKQVSFNFDKGND